MGYFPVLFQENVNPYKYIGDLSSIEVPWRREVSFEDYDKHTGERVDYVIVWLGLKRNTDTEPSRSIYRQLNAKYERIFISENELMELYRYKN
jgi:hypothetical protein